MIQKEEQLEWLHQHQTKEPHLGLERVRRLLALRGNPHLQISVIHIAGTNGKGSTIAHLRQLLQAKRLCIGTFTSPYLLNYNEQIAINGLLISDEDFCSLLQSYQRLLKEQADDTILQEITEFEIITALAYDYFCQQEVDVVIMEVGLGGLLDSTNGDREDFFRNTGSYSHYCSATSGFSCLLWERLSSGVCARLRRGRRLPLFQCLSAERRLSNCSFGHSSG